MKFYNFLIFLVVCFFMVEEGHSKGSKKLYTVYLIPIFRKFILSSHVYMQV